MEDIRIRYGANDHWIDVTELCFTTFRKDEKIYIPSSESARALAFTDPIIGVHKSIMISMHGTDTVYDEHQHVIVDLSHMTIEYRSETQVHDRLEMIQSSLKLVHGSFEDELPEQRMSVRFLTGHETILEIGGNVGRNSLVIASILHDPSNLVVLESNPSISLQLLENRDINGLSFHVENAALSKRRLIQDWWNTKPSEVLEDNSFWVNTISYQDLQSKYTTLTFDTLVLDCEGAFYYILQDFPEILNNIQLILMENDYVDRSHKDYVDHVLRETSFQLVYREGGGAQQPQQFQHVWHCFFEVWKRF